MDSLSRAHMHNDHEIDRLRAQIAVLEQENRDLKRGFVWQTMTLFHSRVIEPLLGKQTKRRAMYDLGLNSLRILVNDGSTALRWNVAQYKKKSRKRPPLPVNPNHRIPKSRAGMIEKRVSIIIPTRNAGPDFHFLLHKIQAQENIRSIEILVIDSGSTDSTVQTARENNCTVLEIDPKEFHHGATRNQAAAHATGDYLVFMVQDALPVGEWWLHQLVQVFEERPNVAAVTCRQIPRIDADLYARYNIWAHYSAMGFYSDKIVSRPRDSASLDLNGWRELAQLDDVCTAIRADVFKKYSYRTDYAEDLDLGMRLLQHDQDLAFLHSCAVIHSHNRSASYFFRRRYADSIIIRSLFSSQDETGDIASEENTSSLISTLSWFFSAVTDAVDRTCDTQAQSGRDFFLAFKRIYPEVISGNHGGENKYCRYDTELQGLIDEMVAVVQSAGYQSEPTLTRLFDREMTYFEEFITHHYHGSIEVQEIISIIYKIFAASAASAVADMVGWKLTNCPSPELIELDRMLKEGV